MLVLGMSALYHDSAAAIVKDGRIIAAAQEERFSRKKHDNRLPINAINYCLSECGAYFDELDYVVYYDNPFLTLDRYVSNIASFNIAASDPIVKDNFIPLFGVRMWIHEQLRDKYGYIGKNDKLFVTEHHLSHAASAFYPSPFYDAAIVTIDGVGEWASLTIGRGDGKEIEIFKEIDYPHSLGLLYSAFTSFCGFKVNSGDYKFMGLAPYGEPIYYDLLRKEVIDVKDDGSFQLNLDYFDFSRGKYMYSSKMEVLFGGVARMPESMISRREMDIAASVQKLTEEIVLKVCKHARVITGKKNLVMAGGVALNCVANGKIADAGIFDSIWIQPAAGDAGGALGAALLVDYAKGDERPVNKNDGQYGSYLGKAYTNDEIKNFISESGAVLYKYIENDDELFELAAEYLTKNKVIGWMRGRMEYGPRALGNRSILASPLSSEMQSKINLKIKYRESFRPFAPSVTVDDVDTYFNLSQDSPYMLVVGHVKENRRVPFDKESFLSEFQDDMIPVVNAARSDIPAITHIDYSARIQTVDETRNRDYYRLIKNFQKKTGYPVLVNTSFNVRGEPIVCSPEDAFRCFIRTEMDVLFIENYVFLKEQQTVVDTLEDWKNEYELD